MMRFVVDGIPKYLIGIVDDMPVFMMFYL